MRTAIIYASYHHGNTKKLAEEIQKNDPEAVLIDVIKETAADLNDYNRIGVASGIAFGKYYPQMLNFLSEKLPENKDVFFIHTAGDPGENQNAAAKGICDSKNCHMLGTYFCKGFDTYGPFKLIGGIAKGHPDADELAGVVSFYRQLSR